MCAGDWKNSSPFFIDLLGKNKGRAWEEKRRSVGSVGLGGRKKLCEANRFFNYICSMGNVELIGLISAILGILSFFGIGFPLFTFLKKNKVCFKFGTNDAFLFLFKKHGLVFSIRQNQFYGLKK